MSVLLSRLGLTEFRDVAVILLGSYFCGVATKLLLVELRVANGAACCLGSMS